jgi:hypothetical protein
MTRLYGRKSQLLIGLNSSVLDLTSVHFTFRTTAPTVEAYRKLELTLYNLAPETIHKILVEGQTVTLAAGYTDSYGEIFNGTIFQATEGKDDGVTSFLLVTAIDSILLKEALLSITLSRNTNATSRLGSLIRAVGGEIGVINLGEHVATSARGRTYFGTANQHLTLTAAQVNASWTVENGKVDIIGTDKVKNGFMPIFNSKTGLIGRPVQTFNGFNVKVLLTPTIERHGLFKIDNASINQQKADTSKTKNFTNANIAPLSADGVYKVIYIEHEGDSRGTNWYSYIMGTSWYEGLDTIKDMSHKIEG